MAFGNFSECLFSGLGTFARKFGVEFLATVRRCVGNDVRACDFLAPVGFDFIEGSLEILDGFGFELVVSYYRAVDSIKNLAFCRLFDDSLIVVGLVVCLSCFVYKHVGSVGSVSHLAGRNVYSLLLVFDYTTEFEIAFFHARNIVEAYFFSYSGTLGRNCLVVFGNVFALIYEWSHFSFSALVNDDRSHFKDSFRMEVIGRISDGYRSIYLTGHNFKNGRFAVDCNVFRHFCHLFWRAAGYGRNAEDCCRKEFDTLFHCINNYKV